MKVFISRILQPGSDFRTVLQARGYDVHGESLVTFTPVTFENLPAADWLFFYSKNGVRFFFEQIHPEKISNMRLAVIGQGTGDYLEKIYRPPDFTGNGDPVHTATDFLAVARGQRVLFVRAKDSRQSIQQLLGNKVTTQELIVYENRPRLDFNAAPFDVLVFTSPLNAQACFTKNKWRKNQKVVAIGNTTAAALATLGIENVFIAKTPSENGLANAILNI